MASSNENRENHIQSQKLPSLGRRKRLKKLTPVRAKALNFTQEPAIDGICKQRVELEGIKLKKKALNLNSHYDSDVISDEDYLYDSERFDGKSAAKVLLQFRAGLGENSPSIWGVDDLGDEVDEDSDELRSVNGSDDESCQYSFFNPEADFTKPIVLKKGLKFPSNIVLRKALIYHSIENGYDFYYSHNGSDRVTTKCRFRCTTCEWDSKRSKFGECKCSGGPTCKFFIHARPLNASDNFQIKSLNLNHRCVQSKYNRKVSSEYLADKFLDFWKSNIDWKVKSFQSHVLKTLNVHISYGKCWLARSRAKLMIHGKKRKKELGESSCGQVKRIKKPNKCSNCGTPGHSRRKCENPPAPPKQAA